MSQTRTVRLGSIAAARSGDKGSSANIGVIARTEAGFRFLNAWLTSERVLDYFQSLGPSGIHRHAFPKLNAINFILDGVLAGGGSRSLRVDAQGKTLAQAILLAPVEVPTELIDDIIPAEDRPA